jgi:hypothetical protein
MLKENVSEGQPYKLAPVLAYIANLYLFTKREEVMDKKVGLIFDLKELLDSNKSLSKLVGIAIALKSQVKSEGEMNSLMTKIASLMFTDN